MKPKHKRFIVFLISMGCIGCALWLVLQAFSSNLVYFKTPSQLLHENTLKLSDIRMGGMVVAHSILFTQKEKMPCVQFQVTDGQAAIKVHYFGIVPDLFREGQSVIAIGHLDQNKIFIANEILAKHDETYMPKDVADALRKSGKWDPKYGPPPDPKTWNHILKP
ncbi:Cytochrome c-type biogenesis protein CcmE [Commensalibacter sp. Nvir]|uniref:cytochrome c maturation protein CcmE n=1 Tax=Commensalibacter sp. Nvir TaxID=3069817 RepID=UPI002D351C69|nr:Cytochrome c-type biogenesis protein CcmE [Commensalibacter sp. Nvir]